MAAVSLIISGNFPPVSDIADGLSGGGSGWNIGSVSSGQWGPITNKTSNLGHKDLYLKHDGVNEITDLDFSVATYGTTTGYTYGGSASAAADYTNLIAQGANSGTSKNSADNASNGLWIEMQWDVSTANRFDRNARPTFVVAVGAASAGIDLANGIAIKAEAMVYDAPGETAATSPVDGTLGPAGNTVFGSVCHTQFRHYVRQTGAEINGRVQYEIIFSYAFTS